jgi:hypothetical protein
LALVISGVVFGIRLGIGAIFKKLQYPIGEMIIDAVLSVIGGLYLFKVHAKASNEKK